MTIGQRIRYIRKERKMTMDELADKIGVKGATVSRYESGIIAVPSPKVEAIAAALDVTPGYLMGWTDMPDQMNIWELNGSTAEERIAVYAESMKHNTTQSERAKNMRIMNELMNGADDEQMRKLVAMAKLILGKDE